MPNKILFLDDESYLLVALRTYFEPRGFLVDEATTGADAIEKVRANPDGYAVVVVDYQLGDMNGSQAVSAIKEINPDQNILMFSGKGNDPTVLKSVIKAGPLEFIDKHGEDFTELESIIRKMCLKYEQTTMPAGLEVSSSENEKLIGTIPGFFGRSKALAEVAVLVQKYKKIRKTILVLGETGTGKRLICEALHSGSGKYFKINCADYAGKPEFLRSELFGHVKGAFTGAAYEKRGLLEAASGGTFVLDEAHLLSHEAQDQLLTAIEEKIIRRVGGMSEIPIDVKIIAVAKPDLLQMVKESKFKRDLYYRLNQRAILIPPLRERIEDIEPIISHICKKFRKENGIHRTFQKKTVEHLQNYSWPGNVRELENEVEMLLERCPERQVTPTQLESRFFTEVQEEVFPTFPQLEKKIDQMMKDYLSKALKRWDFNKDRVAREIDLSASGLRRYITRLGLKGAPPRRTMIPGGKS